MNNFVINFLSKWGYIAVFVLIIVENIFPPIPSEVILLFSGFMTTYKDMSLFVFIVSASLGSLCGALILYCIGYKLGMDKVKQIVNGRVGKIIHIKESDIDNSKKWFDKNGNKAILFCRFLPLVRSLISIPAGINKMNIFKFSLYTLIGSLIWNSVLISLGKIFASNWGVIASALGKYSVLAVLIFIALFAIFLIYKKKKTDK